DGYLSRLETAALPSEEGQPRSDARLENLTGAAALLEELRLALAPAAYAFEDGPALAGDAARALAESVEILAGPAAWAGPAGEAAAGLIAGLMEEADPLGPLTAQGFAALVETLTAETAVRASGAHPRLQILGALEARLVRADRLVLAGLEEGVWPQGAPLDPFLSRPMRARLDLPSPERRLGLSAHDFVQAACAPEVALVTTERRAGAPAVQSRWLWRLKTLVGGAGARLPDRDDILEIARALDAADPNPPDSLRPAPRPAPAPPVALRPRELPVTGVETWEAAADAFAQSYLDNLRAAGMAEAGLARESPLACRAGLWAAGIERQRRASGPEIQVEAKGEIVLKGFPAGDFKLTARADRIERSQGLGHVLDFKTGAAPTTKMVATGFSPQLTLTAAILDQ
ncbi:MAG: PD-(D/E)XK nuclease family protein, partial [Asticcacaulis sp.]|nr:PD-(D/E)XK nuclease family protein [Asticcacaulis sp.]